MASMAIIRDLPEAIADFIFDLSQSTRRSMRLDDVHLFYTMFRELSDKHYAKSEWPNNENVAKECNDDAIFLVFYR